MITKLLFAIGIVALIVVLALGCKSEESELDGGYKIHQVYEYSTNEHWHSRFDPPEGWKLSTYVSNNKRILESWGIMTDNPDTIKQKHIQLAKEYIEYYKKRRDTIIYIK